MSAGGAASLLSVSQPCTHQIVGVLRSHLRDVTQSPDSHRHALWSRVWQEYNLAGEQRICVISSNDILLTSKIFTCKLFFFKYGVLQQTAAGDSCCYVLVCMICVAVRTCLV